MIKQLLNSAIAKYRDLSVARRSIICLCLRHRQIIDLLATDKSRYFAQSRPIIVYYDPVIVSHVERTLTAVRIELAKNGKIFELVDHFILNHRGKNFARKISACIGTTDSQLLKIDQHTKPEKSCIKFWNNLT